MGIMKSNSLFLSVVTIARNVAVLDSHIVGDENAVVRLNNVAEMSHCESLVITINIYKLNCDLIPHNVILF